MEQNLAMQGLQAAIAKAGGSRALARLLEISPAAVTHWKTRGGIPEGKVPDVMRVTGLAPHQIRPDRYPAPAAP